ncbi:MAG: helix-turn-helix transcriptional regulator [Pseudonocardia sp.]|nr:helix-turn-helix transcriptional regulator [Pseudonocardia sp.]
MSLPGPDDDQDSAPGWERIVGAIGPKVRDARRRLGLSLQQLASQADVSAAAIHKVERGDMVPTITTLLKLAAALRRPISYFVDDAGEQPPVARHTRAAEQPPPATDWAAPGTRGVTASGLDMFGDRMRAEGVYAMIAPNASNGASRQPRRGEQLLLVLDGTLAVEVAGEHYLVQAGDTLHYPSDRPHRWHNPGPVPARAIWWLLRD